MYKDGVSVIICCYNSASRLPATLRHLSAQQVSSGTAWEIIIVDNASTDQTAEKAKAEWTKYNLPDVGFQIVYEEKQGLSNAREKGISTSGFRFVVFCDDDNWLGEGYLQIAYNTLSADSSIAALGGWSTAAAEIPLPGWFEESQNNYAVGRQAEHSGDVSGRKHLWGSGMIIRKELYNQAFANFPSILTGRNGEILSSGEDSEMCMRFLLMGYRLHYLDTLTFKHFIADTRLCAEYNKKLMDGFIKAHEILNIYAQLIDTRSITLGNKLRMAVRPFIRVFTAALTGIKRWNIAHEKLRIFILTGYPFPSIPSRIRAIRHLSDDRKTNRANDC